MSNPYDYINNINSGGKNLMRDSENDVLAEKGYIPFITNRTMSYHYETVLIANMVNQWHHIDNRPQYEFYKAVVRPKKRFAKWEKSEKDAFINTLTELYNCSVKTAEQYASLLNEEQKQELLKKCNKGGK